ncbi:hypothetical protein VTJ49DRAFT_3956 [Mycothermus thermophilus]|uniref:CorA-like transporter domain-containing protein n=1 Tax=Humicola insolens TaxID=85995 RepID=A0ABR3V7G4_HUMIN
MVLEPDLFRSHPLTEFYERGFRDVDELEHHLVDSQDIRTRHVFIKSNFSKRKLMCSRRLLECVMRHEKIPAAFLRRLSAFSAERSQYGPFVDSGLVGFQARHEGSMLRCWYVLPTPQRRWAMGSDGDPAPWLWTTDVMVVYHSFDLNNGKSFFLSFTGDMDGLLMRAKSPALWAPQAPFHVDGLSLVRNKMKTALSTQLLYLFWANSQWRKVVRSARDSEVANPFRASDLHRVADNYYDHPGSTRLNERATHANL